MLAVHDFHIYTACLEALPRILACLQLQGNYSRASRCHLSPLSCSPNKLDAIKSSRAPAGCAGLLSAQLVAAQSAQAPRTYEARKQISDQYSPPHKQRRAVRCAAIHRTHALWRAAACPQNRSCPTACPAARSCAAVPPCTCQATHAALKCLMNRRCAEQPHPGALRICTLHLVLLLLVFEQS